MDRRMVNDFLNYFSQSADTGMLVPLEYIEGTGTQSIDTGLKVADDLDIEASIQFTSKTLSTGGAPINGGYTSGSGLTYRVDFAGINGDEFWVGCSTNKVSTAVPSALLRHTFHINTATGAWSIDDVSGSVSPVAYPGNPMPILIFDRGQSRLLEAKVRQRVYWVKIKKGGVLVRDYVPMLRLKDNKAGLYDLVTKKLYTNIGTEQFVAGRFTLPSEYRSVDYIENDTSHTQYIDTLYVPNSKTHTRGDLMYISGTFGMFGSFGSSYAVNSFGCNGNSAFYDNYASDVTTSLTSSKVSGKRFVYEKYANVTDITGEITWHYTHNPAVIKDGPTLYLFRTHGGISHKSRMRVYLFDIWDENNIQVRNLTPVVRDSDNKPGLYDLCGSICPLTETPFYVNAGTGEFTWKELTA